MAEKISGIHNYCDRWCERCAFTSRCEVYRTLEEKDALDLDKDNEKFWETLSQNFSEMMTMAR